MHFPLVKTLREITGLPTLAINDAQGGSLAEYQAMADKVSDMAFIRKGLVGGGVVSNGTLLTGAGGLADTWGTR